MYLLLLAVVPLHGVGQTVIITTEKTWYTYVGGTADDRVHSIARDEFGHVYVAD